MKVREKVLSILENQHEQMRSFLFDLCAVNSVDGQIGAVAARAAEEMEKLGFHGTRIDRVGCLIGAVGHGPTSILYDAHLDTVGVVRPDSWGWDPFKGKLESGTFYARGACDTKGCIPGMVYGLAAAAEAGALDNFTLFYYGSLEEQCDGLAPRVLVEEEGLRPDYVVIGEPTDLAVYRAQRGRVELEVQFSGRSAHASMPGEGENPTYRMAPVLQAIELLNEELTARGEGLFRGSVAVTDMRCETASINAIPSSCSLFLDRRLGIGEDAAEAASEIRELIPATLRTSVRVQILRYCEPSYTGYVREVQKIFPAWELPLEDPFFQAGMCAAGEVLGRPATAGGWLGSTNGAYWQGTAGIPAIGFGPGDLRHAHSTLEQVRLDDVAAAARFYALLPLTMETAFPV